MEISEHFFRLTLSFQSWEMKRRKKLWPGQILADWTTKTSVSVSDIRTFFFSSKIGRDSLNDSRSENIKIVISPPVRVPRTGLHLIRWPQSTSYRPVTSRSSLIQRVGHALHSPRPTNCKWISTFITKPTYSRWDFTETLRRESFRFQIHHAISQHCECQRSLSPAQQQYNYIRTRLSNSSAARSCIRCEFGSVRRFFVSFHWSFARLLHDPSISSVQSRGNGIALYQRANDRPSDRSWNCQRSSDFATISAETPARCSSGNWLLLLATGALLFRKHLCSRLEHSIA